MEYNRKKGVFLKEIKFGIKKGFTGGEVFYLLDDMKKETIEQYFLKAFRSFYLRPTKILDLLIHQTKNISELKWLTERGIELLFNKIK